MLCRKGSTQLNYGIKSKRVTYENSVHENVGRTDVPNSVCENMGRTDVLNSVCENVRCTDILNYFIGVRLCI